jgi:hypothetical protein
MVGQPNQPIGDGDTEYIIRILVNYATDLAGNTLDLSQTGGVNYTYFLSEVKAIQENNTYTLLHDDSLNLTIPPNALGGQPAKIKAYTHFYHELLPEPLWYEYGQIGFVQAFHLELAEGTIVNPINIQVSYDPSKVEAGYEESPRLYRKVPEGWGLIPGTKGPGDLITYDTTELGDFAVLWGYPYGDLNPYMTDGLVDIVDVLVVLQYTNGRPIYPDPSLTMSIDSYMALKVGDVNGNGVVNMADALEIARYITRGIPFTVLESPGPSLRALYSSDFAHKAFLSSEFLDNRVSVILDDTTDVFTAAIELMYNPRLLKISEVSKTSLTSDSLMDYNDRNPGKLCLALVNASPLNGAGSLADIQFELMPGVSKTAALDSIKLTKVELNAGFIKTTLGKLPQKLALLQNYPNPFNPETWIPYELNQTADVEIRIYNINGQVVRRLPLGRQSSGSYITRDKAVYWDGANDRGEKVSSGVYFYQLKAGEKSLVRKMVIMK